MKNLALFVLLFVAASASAQDIFTRKDSLRGGLPFERTCYDVRRYDLNVKVNLNENSVAGFNDITFVVVKPTTKIQLDLFENMSVDSIVFNGEKLQYSREFNAVFVNLPLELAQDSENKVRFYYSGKPLIAKNAPWDGGLVISKDSNQNPWVATAVQGTGASLWYPCKDSQSDEPDLGATIKVAVPNGLTDVSNGRFTGSEDLKNGFTRWDWEVKNPINNYDIALNIGDYVHLHDNYKGLDLDYYVLRGNEEKAKKQFAEVKPMMDCFQAKFGSYPFADDGYKLVETPYLGMEHQSAVAYGNNYQKGYLGRDLSGTGIGLSFDYIIIHESGHEWFGNSITSKDIADMWIHEAFTMYAESVYVECLYGKNKALAYLAGLANNISNDKPIIGRYGVNNEGSGDMYYKGALLLNTLRSIVADDDKWWAMLFKYSQVFRYKIIDTQTVVAFFNAETGTDLTSVFDQYLTTADIPVLHFTVENNKLLYRWENVVDGFSMPVDVMIKGKETRLYPTKSFQQLKSRHLDSSDVKVLKNLFLVKVRN